jgi:hypothetical protein
VVYAAHRIGQRAVKGFEIAVIALFGFAIAQARTRPRLQDRRHIPAAAIVRLFLLIYLAGFVFSEVVGLVRGLGPAPWKARNLLHAPLFYVLFNLAFRDALDFAPIKALLAAWFILVAVQGKDPEYATNHGDSVLFAMAIIIVLVLAMERGRRRDVLRALLLTPVPLWGIILNNRRIAWAMLELSLILIYFLTRRRPWKRKVRLVLTIGAPIILAYVAVGWDSGSRIFLPVHKVRTLFDSKDSSTYWREVETWNIATTLREHPFLGTGLGGEYVETMHNDDISGGYKEYREWPHNTVLGLLLMAGMWAFTAIWLLYPFMVFLTARSYRFAADPEERAAALMCMGAIVCAVSMAWGDTGLHFTQVKLDVALALCVAAKLAVSTGAWPTRGRTASRPMVVPDPPRPVV